MMRSSPASGPPCMVSMEKGADLSEVRLYRDMQPPLVLHLGTA